MFRFENLYFFGVLALLFLSCKGNEQSAPKVLVYSAASLTEVMKEFAQVFEKKYGVQVQVSIASSGALARQIEHGVAPDVFITADKKWIDYLASKELVRSQLSKHLSSNDMVLVVPKSYIIDKYNEEDIKTRIYEGRIAIGDPSHVPAGAYAVAVLKQKGWYDDAVVNFFKTKDVRSALMMVEMEEADLGIVYKTDALASSKVNIIHSFSAISGMEINYWGVQCNQSLWAERYFSYLSSSESKQIWKKYGFK